MGRRMVCGGLVFGLLAVLSCSTPNATRRYKEPPPPDIRPTLIQYVDSDGFDGLLESLLVYQDPVIVVQTESPRPEWSGRLNAWIAAWNMGGKVDDEPGKPKARGQVPIPKVVVDGDSIREFRLLVGGLMNRIDDLAKGGAAWWAEEKTKSRRVDLLRPYNLRFHLDANNTIQIILFNGRYSQYHRDWVKSIAVPDEDNREEWSRNAVACSQCKERGARLAKAAAKNNSGGGVSFLPNPLAASKPAPQAYSGSGSRSGPPAKLTGEIRSLDDGEK